MGQETRPFRALLLSIAQDLTTSELKKMKFACESIPDGILEKITAPHELFTELEHRELLAENEKDYLAELLLNIGRQELARKLLGMNAPKIKRSCSMLCGSLPGKVPHFFGRALICEEVIATLHTGRNHLVTITGPPGYGKSAVAISVGHHMVEELDHHVYYASTRGAASVESVAFQLLYSFGIVAGADPLTQTHHYLESLHSDTLLIFDNVEDMLQPGLKNKFLHFIKFIGEMAPHVKMIITSRIALTHFYSFDMKDIRLPSLTNSQAAQLIRIFAPQELSNSHAENLGRLCKGVPLLIRAIASLLAQNVDPELLVKGFERSPGTTLRSLSFEGMPPEFDMYPCLQLCFERLTVEEQRHLVALAVFPSSFNVVDASCVLRDVSDLKRQLIITKLVDYSFVRPDTEGRSFFAVHSIVQVFCREIMKEDEKLMALYEESSNHFNMYFLSMLQDLNEKFYQNADELRAAMVSFECKKNNIFLAVDNSIRGNKLVKYTADLLNSSYRFFTVRLSSDEFRRLYQSLAELFKISGDKKRYTNCLVSLGFHQFWVMCSCRRPCPKATKLFEEAHRNFQELKLTNTEQYAECLSKLARAYAYDRTLEQSVAMVKEAREIIERTDGNMLSRLSIVNDYAAAHSYHNDHTSAIRFREEFLPEAKQHLADHPAVGTLYDELGSSYEALGNMEKSIECRKEAIRIFEGFLGDHKFTASCHLGLGTTLKSEGKCEEALAALRKAFEIQRKTIGPHPDTIITSQEIAKVLLELGRKPEAKEWSEKSCKLTEDQKKMEKKLELLQDMLGYPGDCMDIGNDVSLTGRKRMGRSLSTSFDGMPSGSNYSRMKSKRIDNGPIAALLPVMNTAPDLLMANHYPTSRRMSSDRSYNDKAREALPGLGNWLDSGDMHDAIARKHSTTIDHGGDFLENPLLRSDVISHDAMKRSVSIRTPSHLRHSQLHHSPRSSALGRRLHEGSAILDNGCMPVTLDPPSFDNSARRHELEILTRVDPHSQSLGSNTLGHLYQPLGSTNRPGYAVVGESWENENGMFHHTVGPNKSSFDISPNWVSEKKKSVVIRN